MLYHVISCYIMLYHVISCYIVLYHVISCYIMLYSVISCYIMLYHVISCYIMLCPYQWYISIISVDSKIIPYLPESPSISAIHKHTCQYTNNTCQTTFLAVESSLLIVRGGKVCLRKLLQLHIVPRESHRKPTWFTSDYKPPWHLHGHWLAQVILVIALACLSVDLLVPQVSEAPSCCGCGRKFPLATAA